jgi:hypothetical protein
MTTAAYTYSTTLKVMDCGECAIPFAIPEDLYAARRKDGRSFYCPNGHYISWAENDLAKAQRALKWERDLRASITADRDQAQASLRATKGVVTKLRKRTAAGECPFCGQHLRDLDRHVGRMHSAEAAETLAGPDVSA